MTRLLLLVAMALVIVVYSQRVDARARCVDAATEANLLSANKRVLESRLRDPTPVYRDLYVNCSGGAPIVCGWVNARNGFGGYVGWQRWIGALYQASTESSLGANFERFWFKHCEG